MLPIISEIKINQQPAETWSFSSHVSLILISLRAHFQMDIISPENCYVKECMKETRKRKIEMEEGEVRENVLAALV